MKTYFGNAIKYQNLLNIILSFVLIFAVSLTLSCQSQETAPVPPVPSNGLPLAPTPGEPEPSATPPQIEVTIDGLAFNPAVYNVPVGTTIVWYNNDSVTHTVTARDNLFDSGNLSPGDTFRYTFEQSGALEYYCKIHPSMVGKITIE
jgi:plastocyanin